MTVNAENWIALLDASRDGDVTRVRELLELGTYADCPDIFSGHTPLHHAIVANSVEIVALLLDAGADVNHRNNNTGTSPLECAIIARRQRMIHVLLDRGADLTPDGKSMLKVAREESTPEIAVVVAQYSRDG